jgi:hypothetical protein
MSPELAHSIRRLEFKATGPVITPRQRALLDALKDLGATKVAHSLEEMLRYEERAREEALETVTFLREAVP